MKHEPKQGENEAKIILKGIGYDFDNDYYDDGETENNPDLKFADGTYLEITHTHHNFGAIKNPKPIDSDELKKAYEAYDRIVDCKYNKNNPDWINKFRHDLKLVRKCLGYDISNGIYSENCKNPIFVFNTDNILDAIEIKSEKHGNKKCNLFVFITEDEFECVLKLKNDTRNMATQYFYNRIINFQFEKIWLCVYDFENMSYNTTNPIILQFETSSNSCVLHMYNFKEN